DEFLRVRPVGAMRPADCNRLDILRAEHRPTPAAPRVAAIVRDRRVANLPLSRGTDCGDLVIGIQPFAQTRLRLLIGESPQFASRFDANRAVVDYYYRRLARLASKQNRIVTGLLP